MSAPPSEAARRKNVQDAIDRVLFKVRCALSEGCVVHAALRPKRSLPALCLQRQLFLAPDEQTYTLQINELEAILGNFTGQNELLHAKL